MWLEDRSLHLPRCHNKLLAQKDILHGQFGSRTQQVGSEPGNDTVRTRSQRFADSLRGVAEGRAKFGYDTRKHVSNLLRDEPQFQALVVGEIFNDPLPEQRGSQHSFPIKRATSRAKRDSMLDPYLSQVRIGRGRGGGIDAMSLVASRAEARRLTPCADGNFLLGQSR
jgi:hypothetical protein